MKLLKEYINLLLETSNEDFLDEFRPLFDEWQELQDEYGPINSPFWDDPDGNRHMLQQQEIPDDELPKHTKGAAKKYYDNAHALGNPGSRRAYRAQTDREINIEKKLMRLFQKYADQSFFKNNVTLTHDLGYSAAAHQSFSPEEYGIEYADFDRADYLDEEGKRHKDVLSVHGTTDGKLVGSYGMIINGHVIMASEQDLASQTTRVAPKQQREKHKSSGLPKRTGPNKIGVSKKDLEKRAARNKRFSDLYAKKGKSYHQPTDIKELEKKLNSVVLDANDVSSGRIEEILVDNWTIEGWYFSGSEPHPDKFWKKAYEKGITKPVYSIDGMGNKKEFDLEAYYSESSNIAELKLRECIRELLKEDPIGFVHDLAASSNEFGEEGIPFFGGNPGKAGGKAIKRAFAANADYSFLNSLDTVHWTTTYGLSDLEGKGRDELSTTMSLPGEDFNPAEALEVGLWVKGRITLAANDHNALYTGHYKNKKPDPDTEEGKREIHRDKSSGRNKLPTVSKDYSRYGNLKRDTDFGEKMARNIPYVLDKSTWSPGRWTSINEALVDNWGPVGIISTRPDVQRSIQSMSDLKTVEDIKEYAVGQTQQIMLAALSFGVPIFDESRNILWSPK